MRLYGLWNGGVGYTPGGFEDIEVFNSLKEAKSCLEDRYNSHGPHSFEFVNKASDYTHTPCVEDDCELWLWSYMPDDDGDLYPGSILTLTENGNAKESPA